MADAKPLTEFDWALRGEVYRQLIDRFEAPAPADLAAALEAPAAEVAASLRRLDAGHQLVLAPGATRLWMAHPFSAVPTEYPVEVDGGTYWGNCAWDSFGIPAVTGGDGRTVTRCAESGTPLEYGVRHGDLVGGDAVIHFVVPARHWYDNIAFT